MNFLPYKAVKILNKDRRIARDKDSLNDFWLEIDELYQKKHIVYHEI